MREDMWWKQSRGDKDVLSQFSYLTSSPPFCKRLSSGATGVNRTVLSFCLSGPLFFTSTWLQFKNCASSHWLRLLSAACILFSADNRSATNMPLRRVETGQEDAQIKQHPEERSNETRRGELDKMKFSKVWRRAGRKNKEMRQNKGRWEGCRCP